jgi:hypothetical protein
MSLTRRRFVEAASLTLLAGTVRPIAFALRGRGLDAGPFSPENVAVLDEASEETFKPLIGETFSVLQGNRRLEELTLLSVTSAASPNAESRLPRVGRPSKPSEQPVSSFSLRFETSGNALPQGTYTLRNESMGNFPLFIVPSGPGITPLSYTATFSQLTL